MAALLVGGVLASCGFATDTPLGISTERTSFAPGEDVQGQVRNPDGRITVTLVRAPQAARQRGEVARLKQDVDAEGVILCDYDDDDQSFDCPTTDLVDGLYVAQVTDASQPGEGTQSVPVAISSVPGYAPQVGGASDPAAADGEYPVVNAAVGDPIWLPLSGWEPGSVVQVVVIGENNRVVARTKVTVDAQGNASARVEPLAGGHHVVLVRDGLWVEHLSLVVG